MCVYGGRCVDKSLYAHSYLFGSVHGHGGVYTTTIHGDVGVSIVISPFLYGVALCMY